VLNIYAWHTVVSDVINITVFEAAIIWVNGDNRHVRLSVCPFVS